MKKELTRSKNYTKHSDLLGGDLVLDKERDNVITVSNTEKPVFFNNGYSWYIDRYFQNYLENQQAENLPSLKGYGVFKVSGLGNNEYVLINDNQQVLTAYNYNAEGKDQMTARINIMKVSKHFDDYEKKNV